MVFLTPGTSTLCWESPVGVLKGLCFTHCLHPLQIFRMFKVLIEKQFLREGFSFSNWPGAWCRIYAYKFLITKLRDCSVHAYAEYIRSCCLSPLIEKLLCMWFGQEEEKEGQMCVVVFSRFVFWFVLKLDLVSLYVFLVTIMRNAVLRIL